MEETKSMSSAIEQGSRENRNSVLYARRAPDVPLDADSEQEYYMKHLNDPNFDLKNNKPGSLRSYETEHDHLKKNDYSPSYIHDTDSQSDRYSSTKAESVADFEDESPYPEVRAAVSSVDDHHMPCNTFRMWLLGTFFMSVITVFNQIFAFRYPSIWLTGIVVQLVSLPCGHALARILPKTTFNVFGFKFTLNPNAPFSVKEHVCVTVMANIGAGGVYITEVTMAQRLFYGHSVPWSFQILAALGSQIFGFSLGGMLRQFVVWPSSMIWPGALVNSALFNTLHKNYGQKASARHITRERFFVLAMLGSFVWFWFPSYLFTALSVFNWVCWIAPNNITVNALFGANTGLGMSMLTFDWNMIAFIGSPLVTPWWSEMNTAAAFVLMFWLICPIIYFTNTWNTAFFPISSYYSYDNTAMPYAATEILTDGIFDAAKYEAYSPVYMSATLALAYGISFAAFLSVFSHTFLWFRKDIVRRFRSTLTSERDVHSRLMQRYSEVPIWWYLTIGVISFVFLVVAVVVNRNSQLPVWALLIACILAAILSLPLAMLQAITNQTVPTQVMHELIIGYILPGRPVANMIFKSVAFTGSYQAIIFAGDLKLGHYMKVPPRVMFSVQVFAAVVSSFFVVGMQDWMFTHIPDFCSPTQKDGFKCPGSSTFFTASVIWGAVGPGRLFSAGQRYNALLWFFPIGFLLPIPFYFLARRFPLSFWRFVNIPIFFAGLGAMPPASGINYISWALVGFIFNYLVRRFHFRWWMRYNYILSAALDSGVAIASLVVFFALQFPKDGIYVNWWGNEVWLNTADANGLPLKVLAEGQIIGQS